MKIFIIPIPDKFRPEHYFIYDGIPNILGPNSMEDQFYKWIINSKYVTTNYKEADFYYLPIFWNKCKKYNILDVSVLDKLISKYDLSKIFTINTMELEWIKWDKLKHMIVFSGGFTPLKDNRINDIPILRHDLLKNKEIKKKNKMSFVGKWVSHSLRQSSILHLSNNNKLFTIKGYSEKWTDILQESYISYCPLGYFPNTIRFWESLQLGVVPLVYSKYDFRPFKEFIKWDDFSFFVNDIKKIDDIINIDNEILLNMGIKGKEFFNNNIWNSNWCKYIIKHLHLHLY